MLNILFVLCLFYQLDCWTGGNEVGGGAVKWHDA